MRKRKKYNISVSSSTLCSRKKTENVCLTTKFDLTFKQNQKKNFGSISKLLGEIFGSPVLYMGIV